MPTSCPSAPGAACAAAACAFLPRRVTNFTRPSHRSYIVSLYYALMQISTVGFGDLVPQSAAELGIVLLLLILFLPIFPWVVGEASTVLLKFNVRENECGVSPNFTTPNPFVISRMQVPLQCGRRPPPAAALRLLAAAGVPRHAVLQPRVRSPRPK